MIGRRIRNAISQRQNVIATGGASKRKARPTAQLPAQSKTAQLGNRNGSQVRQRELNVAISMSYALVRTRASRYVQRVTLKACGVLFSMDGRRRRLLVEHHHESRVTIRALRQVIRIQAPGEGERSWSTRNSRYQPGGAMVPSGGAVALTAVAVVPVMAQPT